MDDRVQRLFAELAGLPESGRLARMAELTGVIPEEVRMEVESLLRFDGATGASTSLFQGPMAVAAKSLFDRIPASRCLGNYRILRLLGEGGMGRVYEAEQLDSGRRVALKVLHSIAPSVEERERFLREGRLAAAVRHPNSVFVYGSEEAAGSATLFIVMELVSGGTLKDRLQQSGPFDFQEAARVTIQLLNGLEAAHAAGVLHRDIKPSNCFLDENGQVKQCLCAGLISDYP